MRESKLEKVRRLEEKLTYADPKESAKLTKKLAALKNEWVNG